MRVGGGEEAEALTRLDRPVQFLKGVGPRRADAFRKLGLGTARDVLYHLPRRYDDASTLTPIARLEKGMDASILGRVRTKGVIPTRSGLRIFQAVLKDATGMVTCAWPGQPWLERKIREGDEILASGPVRFFHGRQLHPREFVITARAGEAGRGDEDGGGGTIFTSYPASDEIPQWVMRRVFEENLDTLLAEVAEEEFLPEALLASLDLPPLGEALTLLHRPRALDETERGRRRLAFDEFLFLQLVQALARRAQDEAEPGIPHRRTNALIRPLHESLPFPLTGAQARVLREIYADMTAPRRMNRFLQGDVGAGKTLVALFAMLLAVEGGYQAALMAPTELLAEQHARKLRELTAPLAEGEGLGVGLLTGSLGARARAETLEGLREGRIPLVVGTHALIQEGVRFARPGLVVVDEQHRFGVRQRMALRQGAGEGGEGTPDVLVMSATPIPRSLALTLHGDMDLSLLDELPPGRTPVRTLLRRPSQREEVWSGVARELEAGRQGYVVYPLVEASEKVELQAATEAFETLRDEVFPGRTLGLLHGQMPSEEKDAVMRRFRDGEVDLLVATTVIEVGIDVPNATVMVIEHAERFGLSQLHQLRGRVGRGGGEAWCVLVAEGGDAAMERLKVFASTTDGFAIARADLQIRGQGDLFGAQQSGRDPTLRYADLVRDEDLLLEARTLARGMVEADPELARPEHVRMRGILRTRHAERLRLWKVG